jgi:hypothetical protein
VAQFSMPSAATVSPSCLLNPMVEPTIAASQWSALTLTMAATASNVSERDLFGTWYNDHIRTASLSADYRIQDRFGGTSFATLPHRQGLDIFGASHFDDDLLSRDGASSNFSVLNLWFTRYQTLNDALSIKISVASQTPRRGRCSRRSNSISAGRLSAGVMARPRSVATMVLPVRSSCASTRSSISATGAAISSTPSATPTLSGMTVYRLSDGLSLTSAGAGAPFFLWDDLQADFGVAVPLSYRAPDNTPAARASCLRS